MPQFGIDSVTVPGVVDGWAKLHDRFGKLPWRDLFQPAIFYADHGYPVPEMIHDYWAGAATPLMPNPESRRVFLPDGKAPGYRPDLPQSRPCRMRSRLIAEQGEVRVLHGAHRAGHPEDHRRELAAP